RWHDRGAPQEHHQGRVARTGADPTLSARALLLITAALVVLAGAADAGARARAKAGTPTAPPPTLRFFLAGGGHLVLQHGHFNTSLDVRYRHADGTYDPAALAQIRHFFRSREDGQEAPISLRLIELLAYIQ